MDRDWNKVIREFCYHELELAKRFSSSREEMLRACSSCLSVVMFAQKEGLVKFKDVDEWWDNLRSHFYNDNFGGEEND